MPSYAYRCEDPSCKKAFSKILSIPDRHLAQTCPHCNGSAEQVIAEGVGGVLRGDVWPGKNIRVKGQMAARRAAVGVREHALKMDGPQFGLAPNVGGERVDSWQEASKLAASQGKSTEEYEKRAYKAKKRGMKS